jgi:hypothetical protein
MGKVGIRERWLPLGHTVLYGEYIRAEGHDTTFDLVEGDSTTATTADTAVKVWGGGVVQEIDAAAMSLWVKYRHLDASTDGTFAADNFDEVAMGGLINY